MSAEDGSADPSCTLGIAGSADIDGILALQEANQPERGGSLSARLPRAWLEGAIEAMPVVAARRGGRVVGFLIAASRERYAGVAIVAAMLGAYPGSPDAYVYGPVCVAAEERGRGLAGAMAAELRRLLPKREAILFIRSDNTPSLHAHARMGMKQVAEFTHDGAHFVVLSFGTEQLGEKDQDGQ